MTSFLFTRQELAVNEMSKYESLDELNIVYSSQQPHLYNSIRQTDLSEQSPVILQQDLGESGSNSFDQDATNYDVLRRQTLYNGDRITNQKHLYAKVDENDETYQCIDDFNSQPYEEIPTNLEVVVN